MMLSAKGIIMREDRTLVISPLTRDDLSVLAEPRVGPSPVKKLRDSHHRIARLFALDLTYTEVAKRTGYSYTRISILAADPSFKELVAFYRGKIDASITKLEDEYIETLTGNAVRAERMIADRLDQAEEDGDLLPVRDLIAISRDAADRIGYGKHATQVNVNVDFAKNLEAAVRRSSTARRTLEHTPSPPMAPLPAIEPAGAEPQRADPPALALVKRIA